MTNESKARLARRVVGVLKRLLGAAFLERFILAACRFSTVGRLLRVGSLVDAYRRTVQEEDPRLARMEGYTLWVNIRENIGAVHYFWGRHMPPEAFWPFVAPGAVVMDVGSNMGSWCVWAAWRSGPSGRVFAFEPNPRNHRLISLSIAENRFGNRIHLDSRAVSDATGEVLRFYLATDPGNSGASSLDFDPELMDSARYLEVETVTFSDFCREKGVQHVDFVKVDVERAELQVLRGMRAMLEEFRVDRLLVELFAGSEAHRLLDAIGYLAYAVDHETGRFRPASEVREGDFTDLLFVRPGLEPTVGPEGASAQR